MSPIEQTAAWLIGACRVAVLTGAGVSAESGIPTFRGAGGLWQGRDPLSLATPGAFAADPATVWAFYNYRRGVVANAEPNPAHVALAALADRVPSLTLITQNVDRLHQRAGSRDVLELHGNLDEVRCVGCGRTTDRRGESLPDRPICNTCGAPLRPAVVWFGESLPRSIWEAAEAAVSSSDLMLVVGTSAVVHPAAGLAGLARIAGARVVEINLDATPITDEVDLRVEAKAGEALPAILSAMNR